MVGGPHRAGKRSGSRTEWNRKKVEHKLEDSGMDMWLSADNNETQSNQEMDISAEVYAKEKNSLSDRTETDRTLHIPHSYNTYHTQIT